MPSLKGDHEDHHLWGQLRIGAKSCAKAARLSAVRKMAALSPYLQMLRGK